MQGTGASGMLGTLRSATNAERMATLSSILDRTIREWLEYHQKRVHQGNLNNFPHLQQRWLGRILWKNPLDCWIYQEILYETKPELVIEIGVGHGGSALYLAHLLDLIGIPKARVAGIDRDLSRVTDLQHPRLRLVEGECLATATLKAVRRLARGRRTMVIADCDHTQDHVLAELRAYAPLVSVGCYYIVEDGICDAMNWPPVPGPRAACLEFLRQERRFVNDRELREKYLITYNFDGYLKRVG